MIFIHLFTFKHISIFHPLIGRISSFLGSHWAPSVWECGYTFSFFNWTNKRKKELFCTYKYSLDIQTRQSTRLSIPCIYGYLIRCLQQHLRQYMCKWANWKCHSSTYLQHNSIRPWSPRNLISSILLINLLFSSFTMYATAVRDCEVFSRLHIPKHGEIDMTRYYGLSK